jgi:RimJ/RimL family protein N-acetyltransferase
VTAVEPLEPVEITAGSVHLRAPRLDDVDVVTAACQDPEIQRWTRVPSPYRRDDAVHYVQELAERGWADGTTASFLALDATSAELLASVSLQRIAAGTADVGYWVAAGARGRGVGTTAVGAVCRWGFGALGLERIGWTAAVGNVGSRRLAERLGFRVEGTLRAGLEQRGHRRDGWIGSLLPSDRPPAPPPQVADGPVRLRPWRPDDAGALPGLVDDEVLRWTPLPKPFDAVAFVAGTSRAMQWAVEVDSTLAGGAVLIERPAPDGGAPPSVALGYWLGPATRGQGHAERVVRLLMAVARDRGTTRLELEIVPGNEPSRRLAARLGFAHEGTLRRARRQRGELVDVEVHAMIDTDPDWF